jgi:hypothetical protein
MRGSDYYPAGAYYDANAPWNQVEVPDIEVKCVTTMPMQKTISVMTDQYTVDEDGDTELLDNYGDLREKVLDQHYDIPTLLEELAKYIKGELENGNLSYQRKLELNDMLDDCEGWEMGDVDVEDYEL